MVESAGTTVEIEAGRILLEVSGEDRASFLHGMLSNDVSGLGIGCGASALLLTEQGRIVAAVDLLVLTDVILLDLTRTAGERLLPALQRFIVADDVEFAAQPGVAVAVRGPEAETLLAGVLSPEAVLEPGQHRLIEVGGMVAHLSRVDDLGDVGYRVWCSTAEAAQDFSSRCIAAGAQPLSLEAREEQRISAGVAREDADYDVTTLAPEVPSLAHAISNRKGCYLGQEVVERVASRGKVKWLVAAVCVSGDCASGDELQEEGRGVGHLTSVSSRGSDGEVAAIARVRRDVFDEGRPFQVMTAGGAVGARPRAKPAAPPKLA